MKISAILLTAISLASCLSFTTAFGDIVDTTPPSGPQSPAEMKIRVKQISDFMSFLSSEFVTVMYGEQMSAAEVTTEWRKLDCASKPDDYVCPSDPSDSTYGTDGCCSGWGTVARRCWDANEEWKKSLGKTYIVPPSFGNEGRIEASTSCNPVCADMPNHPACQKETYAGPTVCGTNGKEDGEDDFKYMPGQPIEDFTDCSTGSSHEISSLEEDCSWDDASGSEKCVKTGCAFGDHSNFLKAAELFAKAKEDNEIDAVISSPAWGELIEPMMKLMPYTRAIVSSSPSADRSAVINLNAGYDPVTSASCTLFMLSPTLNGELNAMGSMMIATDVYVYDDATITISDTDFALVIGGYNYGKVLSTTTGDVEIYNLENHGAVDIQDAKFTLLWNIVNHGDVHASNMNDALLENIENHGDVKIVDSKGTGVAIKNAGTIHFSGKTHIIADFESNLGGTIIIDAGVTGRITVPSGPNGGTIENNGDVVVTSLP